MPTQHSVPMQRCACLLGCSYAENRICWQQLWIEMQQDDRETRDTFVHCFRAGHYSCPLKRSCKVPGMATTSIGLCQISLVPPAEEKWEKTERAELRAARLLPNDDTRRCHKSSAWILQRTVQPTWFQSHPDRSSGHLSKQCCCFPADVWTGFLCWSLVWNQLGFNYPQDEEGMQLSY